MRRATRFLVAAVVGALAVAAAGCLPYTGPGTGPRLAQVGDSLTKLAGGEVTSLGLQRGWRVWWDGIVGYTVAQRRPVIDQAAADRPDMLVIELGTNDVAFPAGAAAGAAREAQFSRIVADMRSAFAAAAGSGAGCVVWVTPSSRATGVGYSWDPTVFNVLAARYADAVEAEADRYPNATTADWDAALEGRPEWLQVDGIHTSLAGDWGLAQTIVEAAEDCDGTPTTPASTSDRIAPAVAGDVGGRLHALAGQADGSLHLAAQVAPNSGWGPWAAFGGSSPSSPALARNADGRLEAFWTSPSGAVLHAWQWGSGWAPAVSLGGSLGLGAGVAATANADGRLEVFVVGPDGRLWHAWQTAPNVGGDGWTGWSALPGTWRGTPAAVANADGRLEVFVTSPDGRLHHAAQVAPNSGWSSFSTLGGSVAADATPAAARNLSGTLEVFVRGSDGRLYHQWQQAPAGVWGGTWWRMDDRTWRGSPAVAANADGRLEVFVAGQDNQFWHAWQLAPDSPWGDWVPLGGSTP